MIMATVAEQFLRTEQAANALLEELESLRSETRHYSTAASSLETAGRSLSALASEATSLSASMRETVLSLKEIGTAQLLEGLERLAERYNEHAVQLQGLGDLVRQSTTSMTATASTIRSLAGDLKQGHAEITSLLKQALSRIDHVGTALITADQKTAQLLSTADSLVGTTAALDGKVDAARTALAQIQNQSDKIGSTVRATGAKLDAFVPMTEQRLQVLTDENKRLVHSVRLAAWSAGMALASSLLTLVYLVMTHR
jgi:chromosome segregation ATPase